MPEPISGDDKRLEVINKLLELDGDDEKSGGKFFKTMATGDRIANTVSSRYYHFRHGRECLYRCEGGLS